MVDQAPYFLKMRRWWKGVDIFQKAYLLFPVHAEFLKQEWSYLNEPGSLEGFHLHGSVRRNLPRNICKKAIEVPQQENDYDCGLFVLYYMKRFIEEAPERLHEKDLSKFGKRWFQPEEASALRKELRALLLRLFEEAKYNSDMTEPASRERPFR
ncbi:hypothetical protein GUJ93_ZPchr0006g44117 [Zizania palustris]|uniref:Ubiquitin-like protease family profile domain-containing protein n=1 Tax=Zizania palustris TaxID=103762 RepID=A0A8J5VX34_ZIZPA|nr:hypothetical protein GUJ93_ZPchr0006g44683 [Zizania palustris]KAG8075886.1 hypothetical protein GUJ93_ZPchr0006g44117 [Zizania palustris]